MTLDLLLTLITVNITYNNGIQLTIVIHVDDMMITCVDKTFLNKIIKFITDTFPETNVSIGMTHNYLGMIFDFTVKGKVRVSQPKYINDLINMWNIDSELSTPANQYLFDMRDSVLLDDNDKSDFHTCVAQLLCLGKRTRPDILLPVTFLASRVQSPTVDNHSKLIRVLKYVKHTKHLGITFKCNVMSVIAYIDASYKCHDDGRSHSG